MSYSCAGKKLRPKNIVFLGTAILIFCLVLGGCAHTVTSYSRLSNSELKEYKHVKKLVIAPVDKGASPTVFHKVKILEDARIHRMVREVSEVTISRYPYSLSRKVDDCLIGILGAPFAPIAMLGGLANGEADMVFFPLSAFNPVQNFRPDKAGLFTDAQPMECEKITQTGNWQPVETIDNLEPLALSKIQVNSKYGQVIVSTDKNGIANLDLSKLFDLSTPYPDLHIHIRTANSLQCAYIVPKDRFLAASGQTAPIVRPEPPPEKSIITPMPNVPTNRSPLLRELDGKQERLLVYKVGDYGYWVNKDGLAVLALPTKESVKIYADEYMRYPHREPLETGYGYYIFEFAFDPVKQITLAVKLGESPYEKEAYGWVSAQNVYLWNSSYRLHINRPFSIYPTYESESWQNKAIAQKYTPTRDTVFPVLEQRESSWCIAYPSENGLKYGWIKWEKSMGQLEVRLMKHKLDAALGYLEQEVIKGQPPETLQQGLKIKLSGPLSLIKVTWERYLSAFNREVLQENEISGRFLDIPPAHKDYVKYRGTIIYLAELLLKKDLWKGRDILYIPAGWLK